MTVDQGLDKLTQQPGTQEPQEGRRVSSVCFLLIKKVSHLNAVCWFISLTPQFILERSESGVLVIYAPFVIPVNIVHPA